MVKSEVARSKNLQFSFLRRESKSYGGVLLNTRKGRAHGRPLDTKNTMHLVLRSSKAVGDWSFRKPANQIKIQSIIQKFSIKYGVKILSLANVGNHLHFHVKLTNRYSYKAFIRAITASIAMAVTGVSRWNPTVTNKSLKNSVVSDAASSSVAMHIKFWDYRPFTRVILGFRALVNLKDYIDINQLEGLGYRRPQAKFMISGRHGPPGSNFH